MTEGQLEVVKEMERAQNSQLRRTMEDICDDIDAQIFFLGHDLKHGTKNRAIEKYARGESE